MCGGGEAERGGGASGGGGGGHDLSAGHGSGKTLHGT